MREKQGAVAGQEDFRDEDKLNKACVESERIMPPHIDVGSSEDYIHRISNRLKNKETAWAASL